MSEIKELVLFAMILVGILLSFVVVMAIESAMWPTRTLVFVGGGAMLLQLTAGAEVLRCCPRKRRWNK